MNDANGMDELEGLSYVPHLRVPVALAWITHQSE
jgi:hypothetical protein